MKFNLIIFFFAFGFLLVANLTAQEIKERKSAADSLLQFVKKITPEKRGEIPKINDGDLELVKKYYYNAYAYAPVETEKKFHQWYLNWGEKVKREGLESAGELPAIRFKRIKEKLAEKYDWDYVWFLETPYVLKVKILSIYGSAYKGFHGEVNFAQVDMKAKILEVIKGKEFFQEGETVTISYLPVWYSDCDCPVNFQEGAVYVLPLKPWFYKNNKGAKELRIKNNGMKHFYKIENNTVLRPFVKESDYSEDWETFRKNFIGKYIFR